MLAKLKRKFGKSSKEPSVVVDSLAPIHQREREIREMLDPKFEPLFIEIYRAIVDGMEKKELKSVYDRLFVITNDDDVLSFLEAVVAHGIVAGQQDKFEKFSTFLKGLGSGEREVAECVEAVLLNSSFVLATKEKAWDEAPSREGVFSNAAVFAAHSSSEESISLSLLGPVSKS